MSFVIRNSGPQDAEAIGVLAGEFQAYLRSLGDTTEFDWGAAQYLRDGFGEDPAFQGLIAETDSGVVGYLLYYFGYDTDRGQRFLFVIDLFVTETFRRQGTAGALMKQAANVGRARSAELIVWSVYKLNEMALRFYENLGAAPIDGHYFMSLPIPGQTT